jgi:tetratricopeptide (TPR) repeat protein
MPPQQNLVNVDEKHLHTLCEDGNYTQALQTIDAWGLPGLLDEQPDAPGHAGLALLLANLYRDLARYTPAEHYYLQALAGLARSPGKGHPGYARGLVELGTLYQLLNQHDEARGRFEDACAVHEAAAEPDPVEHARALRALAGLHDTLGDRREAEVCLTRARALIEQAGSPPLEFAGLLLDEAWLLPRVRGMLDAVSRARQALAIYREHRGDRHPGTLRAGYRLGRLLLSLCQFEEAGGLLEATAGAWRETLGEEHPSHAAALEALARLRLAQGDPAGAEKLVRQSLALTGAALGDRHLETADGHELLGRVLQRGGRRLSDAAESFSQALATVVHVLGDEHPRAAELRIDLAEVHEALGRTGDAVEGVREALALLDRHPGDVRYEQMHACLALARLRLEAGGLDEAAALVRRAGALADQLAPDPFLQGPALLLDLQLRVVRGEAAEAAALSERAERVLAGLPPAHWLRMQAVAHRAGVARLEGDPARAVALARDLARHVEEAHGERSPWLPGALGFLGEQLQDAGDFPESERAYERALTLQRRLLGPEHLDLAATLRGLARLHLARGNPGAAEVRYREALDIRRGCLGDSHPDTAQSLTDLASLAHMAGNLIAAESLFRQALRLLQDGRGPTHADTLVCLHGLARLLGTVGELVRAADLLEGALARVEEQHPHRPPLQHALAALANARGDPVRALALLGEVLRAQEKALGPHHGALLPVLADLAAVHTGLGDHLAARELVERIQAVHGRAPRPDPLALAFDLGTLSESYRQLGDAERAHGLARQALGAARRPLGRRHPGLVPYETHFARACQARSAFAAARRHVAAALRLVQKEGGQRHPQVAALWMDLAGLEVARGRPHRATSLYTQAADLLALTLGEDHPDHAVARRILGQHLQARGAYAGAEEALLRSLSTLQRTAGPGHPAVAIAYQVLAELHRQRGDLPAAAAACRHALDVIRRIQPPLDAVHANLLHALAVLDRQQGQLDEAAKLLGHALAIDQSSTGEAGLAPVASLLELAQIEAARGEEARALPCLRRVLAFQDEWAAVLACVPPGRGADAWPAGPWGVVESLLTLALRLPEAAEAALDGVLRWKGLGCADLLLGEREALRRRYPVLARELDRLFDLSVQIAGRLIKGAGPEGLPMHHDLLRRWEEERLGLEGELAGAVPALARLRALRSVTVAGLRRALPAGATLIEIVRFRPRDFAAMCAGRGGLLAPRYLGFVLHAEGEGVVLCDLGPAADRERRGGVEALRRALALHLAGRCPLFVAADGRLGRAARVGLGGSRAPVRILASGRELVSPLLVRPAGRLARLRTWLTG